MRKPNHTSIIVTVLIILLCKIAGCIIVLPFVVSLYWLLLATLLDTILLFSMYVSV